MVYSSPPQITQAFRPLEVPVEAAFARAVQGTEGTALSAPALKLLEQVRGVIIDYGLDCAHLYVGNNGMECERMDFTPSAAEPEQLEVVLKSPIRYGHGFIRITAKADETSQVFIRRMSSHFRDNEMSFTTYPQDTERSNNVRKIVKFHTEASKPNESWFHGRKGGGLQPAAYYAQFMGVDFEEPATPSM
jgi:hypothetical protein